MARSQGDSLDLGSLGLHTDTVGSATTTVSLGQVNGGATSAVSLDDYGIDGVGSITGDTTPDESTTENYTLGFTNAGSKFLASNLATNSDHYSWTILNEENAATANNSATGYIAAITFGAASSNDAATVRVTFADQFNTHATNYNTAIDLSITIQDTYGGGGGCFALDTPILMSDGSTKLIEDIDYDDEVVSFNFPDLVDSDTKKVYSGYTTSSLDSGYYSTSKVVEIYYDYKTYYYLVNNHLKMSNEHYIWVRDNTTNIWRWDYIHNIQDGDYSFMGSNNKEIISVDSIEKIEEELEVMWINVEDVDTVFLGGYLVHNGEKGGGPAAPPGGSE